MNLTENIDIDIDFQEAIGTNFYIMSFLTCIAILVFKNSSRVLYTIDEDSDEDSDEESDEESDEDEDSDEIRNWLTIGLRKKARGYMNELEDCVRDILQIHEEMRQCDIGAKLGIRGGYYNKENNKWYERDRVVAQVLRNMMEAGYVEKVQQVYKLAD